MDFYDSSLVGRDRQILTRLDSPERKARKKLAGAKAGWALKARALLARLDTKGRLVQPVGTRLGRKGKEQP